MRVLYIATDVELPSKKGSSTHTLEVALGLQALGCRVHVLYRRPSRESKTKDHIQGIDLTRIYRGVIAPLGGKGAPSDAGSGGGTFVRWLYDLYLMLVHAPFSALQAVRIAREDSVDAIIERGSSLGAGALTAVVLGKPLVTEVIDYRHSRISLKLSGIAIAYRRDILKVDLPPDRLEIVPAGANTGLFAPRRGESELIGYAGSFRPWHGVEDLIAAARILKERRIGVRFLLVGPGNESAKALARQSGVDDIMNFTGGLPYEELPEALGACGILVAPFNPEKDPYMKIHGFIFSPLKIFEYMSLSKAVIASDLAKIREVISDEKTGLLVQPGDPEGLADAIERLVSRRAESTRIGKRARRTIITLYSWDRLSKLILGALSRTMVEQGK